MQNRENQGQGQQGGHHGANTAGNKNQLAGNAGNPPNQTSSANKSHGDPHRTKLAQKFGQKHGLNQQQSEYAADSFLGSVNWVSQQQRDNDFKDFVNPQTPYTKNPIYPDWKDQFKSRLRKNGFDEDKTNRLGSEEPDEYMRDLSNDGVDENWYRNYGNGRDEDSREHQRSGAANGGSHGETTRREGETQAQADFRDGQSFREQSNDRDGHERNGNHSRDGRSITAEENSDSSDAEGMTQRSRKEELHH